MTAEEHKKYRDIITKIYSNVGTGGYKPESANVYADDDAELYREDHAMFQYSSLKELGTFMMG